MTRLQEMMHEVYRTKGCTMCLKWYQLENKKKEILSQDITKLCIDSNCPIVRYITQYSIILDEINKLKEGLANE